MGLSSKPMTMTTEDGAITDVAGLRVGHHTDARRPTGCTVVIAEAGATSIKDMGKVMAALKARHAGRMDFSKASGATKALLGG